MALTKRAPISDGTSASLAFEQRTYLSWKRLQLMQRVIQSEDKFGRGLVFVDGNVGLNTRSLIDAKMLEPPRPYSPLPRSVVVSSTDTGRKLFTAAMLEQPRSSCIYISCSKNVSTLYCQYGGLDSPAIPVLIA